jgi:hypothetical protein
MTKRQEISGKTITFCRSPLYHPDKFIQDYKLKIQIAPIIVLRLAIYNKTETIGLTLGISFLTKLSIFLNYLNIK